MQSAAKRLFSRYHYDIFDILLTLNILKAFFYMFIVGFEIVLTIETSNRISSELRVNND